MKKQRFTMFVIVTFTLVSCQLFGTKRVDEIEKVTTEAKSMMDNQTPKMIVTNKHLAVGDSILQIVIDNSSSFPLHYGQDFSIEQEGEKGWLPITLPDDYRFDEMTNGVIKYGRIMTGVPIQMFNLASGHYRISMTADYNNMDTSISDDFYIEDNK